eukprot:1792107-Pleurochrysis_carterae.AAC.1
MVREAGGTGCRRALARALPVATRRRGGRGGRIWRALGKAVTPILSLLYHSLKREAAPAGPDAQIRMDHVFSSDAFDVRKVEARSGGSSVE